MSPFGPYPLEAVEPAATGTALLPVQEAHAACRTLLQFLRDLPGALSARQVEYPVSFLAMAGEAAADGGADAPAGMNACGLEQL